MDVEWARDVQATSWVGRDQDATCDDIGSSFLPSANLFADGMTAPALSEQADRQDAASS